MIDYDQPIYPSESQLPVDPMVDVPNGFTEAMRNQPNGFTGDKDIMDTWATSSLTPQIAMAHAPEGHHLSLPFDIRPQAHDIIRTWAFYTIMKAYAHEGKEPWKEALISGFILDPDRKKMSKSKGNVVTPMDLLVKHSADAVRYWASRAKLGIDTAFEEQIMEQGRKLSMKIFNAAKFVFMMTEKSGVDLNADYHKHITNPLDKAYIASLKEVIETAEKSFESNDYAFALEVTEKCFWDFCDNYLELVKGRAYGENPTSAVSTLMLAIDVLMRLFAPFLSFTTEEVWQCRPWGKGNQSVHRAAFPSVEELAHLAGNPAVYEQAAQAINLIRKQKAEEKKSVKTPIEKLVLACSQKEATLLNEAREDILNAANIQNNALTFEDGAQMSIQTCVFGVYEKQA